MNLELIENLKLHLEKCVDLAESKSSKIDDYVSFSDSSMTGEKTRHFYNNLLSYTDSRYLEVGTGEGSSVCSAMYKNKSIVVGVDNFSESSSYNNSENGLMSNLSKYQGENNFKFINSDCYSIDVPSIGKFNMFLYDAGHSYEDQNKALKYFYECLDNIFIFIVDDWNWSDPRNGTLDSIKELNLNILWEKQIFTTDNLDEKIFLPGDVIGKTWWNGIGIFLLEKQKQN
jgi:hypothetical protein